MPDYRKCPECDVSVSRHWTLAMSVEEHRAWMEDSRVCERTQREVKGLITNARERSYEEEPAS